MKNSIRFCLVSLQKLRNNFVYPMCIILTGALVSCQGGIEDQAAKSLVPPSGAKLFREKCSKCHELERAVKADKSESAWVETIKRMKEEHQADIAVEEIDQLVKYHVARQQKEAEVFQEKCQKCHPGRALLEKNISPEQARLIVRQMQEKAGNTITDADVELVVNYHARYQSQKQQEELRKSLSNILGKEALPVAKESTNVISLFLEKCSSCHEAERAMEVFKDDELWVETINKMQARSEGVISDQDAETLIKFHINEQKKEVETFEKTCTICHTDERINKRSMTSEEWLAIVKRMQQKAPDLITDEKVELLAKYHHRREMTMASLFQGLCDQCHVFSDGSDTVLNVDSLNMLVDSANAKFGDVSHLDVQNIIGLHSDRQRREMLLFKSGCSKCHTPEKPKSSPIPLQESVLQISTLQDKKLNPEIEKAVTTQIQFHKSSSKYR